MTRLLTARQAAARLGVAAQYLANLRHRGIGPPFVKVGWLVRYPEDDLEGWVAARRTIRSPHGLGPDSHRIAERSSASPPAADDGGGGRP